MDPEIAIAGMSGERGYLGWRWYVVMPRPTFYMLIRSFKDLHY